MQVIVELWQVEWREYKKKKKERRKIVWKRCERENVKHKLCQFNFSSCGIVKLLRARVSLFRVYTPLAFPLSWYNMVRRAGKLLRGWVFLTHSTPQFAKEYIPRWTNKTCSVLLEQHYWISNDYIAYIYCGQRKVQFYPFIYRVWNFNEYCVRYFLFIHKFWRQKNVKTCFL